VGQSPVGAPLRSSRGYRFLGNTQGCGCAIPKRLTVGRFSPSWAGALIAGVETTNSQANEDSTGHDALDLEQGCPSWFKWTRRSSRRDSDCQDSLNLAITFFAVRPHGFDVHLRLTLGRGPWQMINAAHVARLMQGAYE